MGALLANIYSLGSLTRNFYLADFFDVTIIALLIYSALLLFKQTRSLLAIIGVGILFALYGAAQIFNLYLTSLVLQTFFGVFLVVLVVIFQEELRRLFEFIATISTRKQIQKTGALTSTLMEELIQAMANLAHQKIGALVVLTGHEAIDRHLDGGKALDGLVSEDLLVSIFDPSTPGHDGALIIERDRISQFGAHLPLSTNFKEIGKHGTRHSAALGIAERSDAFAIVVSEEQGTISVASDGTLKTLKNANELEARIYAFLKEKFPEETYKPWETLLKKNSIEKFIAFAGALVLWFFVAFPAGTVQRDFVIPVSVKNLPPELVIENTRPKELTATLGGRGERAFDHIDEQTLALSIDGRTLKAGANTIAVNDDMINRPLNFSVIKVTPPEIHFAIKQYRAEIVPVEIKTKGRVARGSVLGSIMAIPSHITLLISEGAEKPSSIATEVIDMSGTNRTRTVNAKLVIPPGIRLEQDSDETVVVTISIK